MAEQAAFRPEEHFRNLKGQQYLEVKWRVVWFREQHPDGYISTELVEHDPADGLAVFKARAGFTLGDGREVYATGYGSETKKDFTDYLEKSETKAVGRALAMLGYGTAQAIELDEYDRTVVDSPVERRATSTPAARAGLAMVPAAVDLGALRAEVTRALAADPEAAEKLPKTPAEMTEAELVKTSTWLRRRAEAQRKGQTFWVDPGKQQASAAPTGPQDAAEVASDLESHTAELARYVDAVAAHQEALRSTRGPMKPEAIASWRALYTRGQALVGPQEGIDSRPASEVKPGEFAAACGRLVQSALAELAREEVRA